MHPLILCAGVFRSASTWAFNAVRELQTPQTLGVFADRLDLALEAELGGRTGSSSRATSQTRRSGRFAASTVRR